MKLKRLDNVYSPQDLKALILEVRKYARWASQYSVRMRVSKSNSADPPALSGLATDLIKDLANDKPLSEKTLGELIDELESLETTSPRLTITLAAAPSVSLKKRLVEWCRNNIDQSILIDFHYNSTLLGGMVVRYGSHVYDWSFRRQILAASDHFPEVLRRV